MLELKNLSFEVAEEVSQKEIVRDISLSVGEHRFVVITGPNGSGKSTLAKLIAGIEKPTSGQIYFEGADITDKSITERAKLGIAFAFQQPVRFKGIQVLDLIRLAAKKNLSAADACQYLSEVFPALPAGTMSANSPLHHGLAISPASPSALPNASLPYGFLT